MAAVCGASDRGRVVIVYAVAVRAAALCRDMVRLARFAGQAPRRRPTRAELLAATPFDGGIADALAVARDASVHLTSAEQAAWADIVADQRGAGWFNDPLT
jgi:hypothetical protein